MPPVYDLDKIKLATDGPTFEKAVDLYEGGKVTQFEEGIGGYSAVVIGTKPYRVSIEARRHDYITAIPTPPVCYSVSNWSHMLYKKRTI